MHVLEAVVEFVGVHAHICHAARDRMIGNLNLDGEGMEAAMSGPLAPKMADELLILDFLATKGPVPLEFLCAKDWSIHMNTVYTHEIQDSQLQSVMDAMVSNEWIQLNQTDRGVFKKDC